MSSEWIDLYKLKKYIHTVCLSLLTVSPIIKSAQSVLVKVPYRYQRYQPGFYPESDLKGNWWYQTSPLDVPNFGNYQIKHNLEKEHLKLTKGDLTASMLYAFLPPKTSGDILPRVS